MSEEDHIDWLETQQETIRQIGLEQYLAQQLARLTHPGWSARPCRPAPVVPRPRSSCVTCWTIRARPRGVPRSPGGDGHFKGGHLVEISVTVNGSVHTHDVEPRTLLVHYIREQVGLTGTNIGCDTSSCGACTIHIDGESVKSCTVLAVQADGADITTIEGWPPTASCTRCSRRSWRTTACSAATARPAW